MQEPLLRAQSLDNTSADPFGIGRTVLSADDTIGRERVAAAISDITGDNEPAYTSPAVTIWTSGEAVVARVLSSEKDRAGRGSPIVCRADAQNVQDAGDASSEAIRWFAAQIGRTVPEERFGELRRAFSDLVQKKRKQQTVVTVSLIAVLIALLAWLATRPN